MDHAAEARPARPLADWARAADGIQLAGIAVFLLLNTTGLLPWSFWMDAIALWPVLLVSAGIKIAFEKTRAPWLLLLGPVLVLGPLTFVATGSRIDAAAAGPWREHHLQRSASTRTIELASDLVGARLELTAAALPQDALLAARSFEGGDFEGRIETVEQGELTRVRLRGGRNHGVFFVPGRKQRWQLEVPEQLPVRFAMNDVMMRGEFDLSRGRFAGGRLSGVFQALSLRLPATDTPVSLKVAGVFSVLSLTVPEGTPVRVHGAGFPFNFVKRSLPGAAGRAGYDVRLEGIFSAISLDSTSARPAERPKPEAEPQARPRETAPRPPDSRG